MVLPVESRWFYRPKSGGNLTTKHPDMPRFWGKPSSVVIFNSLGPIPRGDILSFECTSSAPIYSWKGPNSCG